MQWSTALSNVWPSTMQHCHGLLERITGKPWPTIKNAAHIPLLNEQDLQQIHAVATTPDSNWVTSQHEVKTLLVGERSSAYSGSGYEFAENQLYVAGDDSRFINWRMLARTGKLYRKVFHEERRPQLWVVVDKRTSMRFGTKKRLKVTQAAIHAICHLYQAQQLQLACGGVILEESPCWFSPTQNMNASHALVKEIIAPAPPLFGQEEKECFNIILRQLVQRLSPGSIIIFISDFHDLRNDILGTLHTLASEHTVFAKHVIDPLEQNLPTHGKFQVISQQNSESFTLDCEDNTFRQQYQAEMKQQQETIENQLTQAGVNYQLCVSDEDIIHETWYE